jgi:hypothetical protein
MKALLAIFFLLMLLAVIAKALGYDGIKKSKKEIKIYAGWPTRIVISCFAFIPVAFFLLEPARTWAGSLLLAILVLPLVLETWITEIRISNEGLFSRSPWRRSKHIMWDEHAGARTGAISKQEIKGRYDGAN